MNSGGSYIIRIVYRFLLKHIKKEYFVYFVFLFWKEKINNIFFSFFIQVVVFCSDLFGISFFFSCILN